MLNYSFKDYCKKNKTIDKNLLWKKYVKDIIHGGGYQPFFTNQVITPQSWESFSNRNIFSLYGGLNSVICDSRIVFINENKESIKDLNVKEPLQIGLIISRNESYGTNRTNQCRWQQNCICQPM